MFTSTPILMLAVNDAPTAKKMLMEQERIADIPARSTLKLKSGFWSQLPAELTPQKSLHAAECGE